MTPDPTGVPTAGGGPSPQTPSAGDSLSYWDFSMRAIRSTAPGNCRAPFAQWEGTRRKRATGELSIPH